MDIVKSYRKQNHLLRLLVSRAGDLGWDVRVEDDSEVVVRAHYADWHRVERACYRFDLTVPALEGWTEVRSGEAC